MFEVVVLTSGGGGNLRAILQSRNHLMLYRVVKVLSDRECGALNVAKEFGVPLEIFNPLNPQSYFESIPESINLVVLAGYMPIVPEEVCFRFTRRIINTHPSLLPKYGGKGMYGIHVHDAVIGGLEKITGCTVHYVSSEIDTGEIIEQSKIIIPSHIKPWDLGGLVFNLETQLLPKVISDFALGVLP